MAILTSTPIRSSTGRLSYLFDKPAHRDGIDRVLAAGGQNISLLHDPETGAIAARQSGDYLQRQFHTVLSRAKNPKRRTQANSIIISFADSELTGTLQERAQQALALADGFMKSSQPDGAQYALCVQADGENGHVHVHCLENAIKTDGKTVQTNSFSVSSLRKKLDGYLSSESEKVTHQPWVNPIAAKSATTDRNSLPVKAPWQQIIKDAVDDVKGHAVSVNDFKNELKDEYGISITERGKAKAWTYHIDFAGKEKKVRGFYQLIDKATGTVRSTRGLGSDYGRESVTAAITDLNHTEASVPTPTPMSEANALMAKLASKTANVKPVPVTNEVEAVQARMAANVAKAEFHKEESNMIFDDDIDEEELRRQTDAETNAAKNHYANLMKADLATHHDTTPAPEPAPVIAVAKQINDAKAVIADTKAADTQAKDDDEQSARGMALYRNRQALATRLVTGFAEANASAQNDSEENNNFGFLQKYVANWTEQDHTDFNQACHDAEASETGGNPDPSDVQARQVKAKVALLERDLGSGYADLFKDRGAHDSEVLKQAREAMDDTEQDCDVTLPAGTVDKTGAVTGGGSTSYSKLMVLARALKQVFMARLLYKQRVTLRTIVRTTMQENRRTKATVQHNADVAKAKQDRIASDLEKWHVVPVGTQTAEQLHSSITRDRAFAQATVKTRGVTDPRQKQQVYDETMGSKYTENRSAWQVIHDRAAKALDRSIANGLPGNAQNDDLSH